MKPAPSARYPVPPKAVGQEFAVVLGRYDRALAILGECDIKLRSGSRLRSYRDALSRYVEQDPPVAATHELERFAFALREIDEIIEIVNGLSQPPKPSEIVLLKTITAGAWHPDDEAENSVRDLQYELWLLSRFRAHGVSAELAEPDLWISWRDQKYPIAAKRPRTRRSLDGCVRDALHQLDRYPSGGLLAISIDLLLRRRGKVLDVPSPLEAAEAMDLVFLEMLQWLTSARAPLSRRAPGRNATTFFVTGSLPAFIRDVGAFCLETRCELLSVKDDQRSGTLAGLREKFSSYQTLTQDCHDLA